VQQTLLRWSEDDGELIPDDPAGALLAADSWLVDDGAVRGYDLHWARFGGSCSELRVPADVLDRFRRAVTAALPRTGRWFPRVELVGSARGDAEGADLLLRLRPASHPLRKGPDLTLMLSLRDQAVAAGADEMLLCNGAGGLIEGCLHSLLWWEDDVLCTTSEERSLRSVTRTLLLSIALERGVALRVRAPLPAQLGGCETWLVNAAHGIREVTAWGDDRAAPAPRAASWREALAATARPLDP
jgi:branched-subunit amino acid aminotransferase/4-amino-4-deoxychorismate lyase